MKTILREFFKNYIEMWKIFNSSEPSIPYDDSIEPMLYIGEVDQEDYIHWLPKIKDTITDFSAIENIIMNQDIKDYFNSYWFLDLKGFFSKLQLQNGHLQ